MTSIVLLALIANTYFIQPDYCRQWATLEILAVAECLSVRETVSRVGAASEHCERTGAHTRRAFSDTTIYKRPRDGVLQNNMQHDKTVH